MTVQFQGSDGLEQILQDSAQLKQAIQSKLEQFGWAEPGDADDVVVDYIISQFIIHKDNRQRFETEIAEIVVHTDSSTESARKISELVDEIYSTVDKICPPAPAPSKPTPEPANRNGWVY